MNIKEDPNDPSVVPMIDLLLLDQPKALGDWANPEELLTFNNITTANRSLQASISLTGRKGPSKSKNVTVFPLFKNMVERGRALRTHKRACSSEYVKCPDFFKYGIRFNPNSDERNVYRTVVISNIPSKILLSMVLDRVRGGMVLDAKLLNTQNITGTNSALVTFVHEHAAMCYEEHAMRCPIVFNDTIARVAILPTPTWPMNPGLHKSVIDDLHTRCLEVHNFPNNFVSPQVLEQDLRLCPQTRTDWVVYKNMGKEKPVVLKLHFSSVEYAGRAFGMFSKYDRYRHTKPCFVPDPCAQPLETLGEIDRLSIRSPGISSHACPNLS